MSAVFRDAAVEPPGAGAAGPGGEGEEPGARRAPWPRILVLGLFAGGVAAFFALGGDEWLRFETLRAHRDELLAYTREHYGRALALAFAVYVATVALGVPGATVLSVAVGCLFGRWVGAALIVTAATLGATLVFLGARYLFADAARRRLGPRARRIVEGFGRDAVSYLLFLRLVPIFPFWLANLIPAFAPVSTRTYVVTTAVGILPGSFVFANLGESLGRIESADQVLSRPVLVALGLLGLLALTPVAVRKLRKPKPGDVL
ncbi:MAG TPA: VTT domain-containing protein [Longimicrobiaceae bacterium]|nr:VTT domain-containing protein [Longimicrobiaceae bacterium]